LLEGINALAIRRKRSRGPLPNPRQRRKIPIAPPLASGQHLVSPDPTVVLKAALYEALRPRDLTVADLSELLNVDWHQAARLIDPKRSSKLTSLATALDAVGCTLDIEAPLTAAVMRMLTPAASEVG